MPIPMPGYWGGILLCLFPALGQLVLTLCFEPAKPVQSLSNNLRGLAPAGQILSLIQFIQTPLPYGPRWEFINDAVALKFNQM